MTDITNTTVAPEALQEVVKEVESSRRVQRGDIGPHNIKGLFHSFQRREARKSNGTSLKVFAHQLAENGNDEERAIALKWIANKAGALRRQEKELRQKNKGSSLVAIRLASKQARRS